MPYSHLFFVYLHRIRGKTFVNNNFDMNENS